MKKKKLIKKFEQRINALEKIVTSNKITLTDPGDKNKTVVLGIENGAFATDVHTVSNDKTNITKTPL
jgi:hypothetical protein